MWVGMDVHVCSGVCCFVCGWVWVYMCVGCVCCFVCGWVWVYMCIGVFGALYVGGYGCTCV